MRYEFEIEELKDYTSEKITFRIHSIFWKVIFSFLEKHEEKILKTEVEVGKAYKVAIEGEIAKCYCVFHDLGDEDLPFKFIEESLDGDYFWLNKYGSDDYDESIEILEEWKD